MDEIQDNLPKDDPQDEVESSEPRFKQLTLFDITFDPGMKDDEGNEAPRPYTKNMMRKWLRKVKWENGKAEKRRKEKAHAKDRRRKAREENRELGPSRKALKKMKIEKPKSGIGIIIDLSFEGLMIEKDRYKVIKQILRSYSINRRSKKPVQFHITSLGETTKGDLSRHNGYENWDIQYHEQLYTELFPKDKIVYLTSESENVIENFEEDTFYVIGGLVDHNQHKGLCHQIAVEQGIRHAQLPLDKYVNMKTRKVLTIDHVFEIVVRIIEGMPWQDVLMKVLPMRKGVQACDNEGLSANEIEVGEEGNSIQSVDSQNTVSRTKRRRNNPPDFLEADGTVREALSSLKTTLDSNRSQEDDDCDLYGKNLAKKLRRLPVDEDCS